MWNFIQLAVLCLMIGTTVLAQDDVCPDGASYWPDMEDCQFYYDCRSDPPIHQQCPGGLYWNQELTTCDYPENVPDCAGGTRPPIGTRPTTTAAPGTTTTPGPSSSAGTPGSTTTNTTPRPSTGGPIPTDCPADGEHLLPYPRDCTLYTKCIQGFPILLRCPSGTLFDTWDRVCKPEGVAVCDVRTFYQTFV